MNKSLLQNVEDIYQLSPMQQGMLFHTLYEPQSSAYFEQSIFTLDGVLNVPALEQAWQRVIERHSILRSSFLWEELENPQQVVHRRVTLPFENQDLSSLSPVDQKQRLEEYIAKDRARGFDLGIAPLMRLALFRISKSVHRLVFSRHHLLLDRWSRSVLLKEVFSLYESFSAGVNVVLSEPPPYADYIAWIDSQDKNLAREYWQSVLRGFTGPTTFAVDRKPNRSVVTEAYASERIVFSETSTERVRTFVREHKLTLNIIVRAAWALLLSRYSGDDDVLFGVTVSGRAPALPNIESMVGLFINTLPARVQVPSSANVLSWLKDLQAAQSQLQQFEYSSLIDIQSWSDVPRGTPLFESILVFENLPVVSTYETHTSDLIFQEDRGLGSTTGYPLTLLVSPGSGMTAQLVYDQTRFSAETIRRLLGHFETILLDLPEKAASPISMVEMLHDEEKDCLLHRWNATDVTYETETVLELFAARVQQSPAEVAVEYGAQQLTYRQLDERSNQWAHYLRSLGVDRDVPVGVCLERGVEMVLTVLAILKAGGVYVPLDPTYPLDRLRFMVNDSKCAVVMTSAEVTEKVPKTEAVVVRVDDAEKVAQQSAAQPSGKVHGEQLAYVIYTSGSTGWPKGVAMPHQALSNLINWQLKAAPFPAARTLQFASLSFDVSFQELFSTWCSGGTLVLVDDEVRRDVNATLRFMIAERVERLFVPFVYLQQLAEAVETNSIVPETLREVITAGEQLELTPQIASLFQRLNGCALENQYGPSETHVVTSYKLRGEASEWPKLPPIGRPVANTQVYIVDRNLNCVPVGIPGELLIGGANVSRGYLGNSDATAAKYVPNNLSGLSGTRLYRTGDLARYLPDGNIEFLGRIDNQVKVRGFRIELGEIEAAIRTHPAVREVVVVAHQDSGSSSLSAYLVVAADEKKGLTRELRNALKQVLPDYMIPSDFVFIEALPLTPSGKINRRAFPVPERGNRADLQTHDSPTTPAQQRLTEIWCATLRRERIGIYENFFELGGHSLLATQLISRVREAFDVELPLRCLFQSPTVAELSASITEFQRNAGKSKPQTIIKDTSRDVEALLATIDELSDVDVEALLNDALAGSKLKR